MEINETKKIIKEVISIVDDVPEPFKEKCFDILLAKYLQEGLIQRKKLTDGKKEPSEEQSQRAKFVIPIDVRAFLQQYEISEDSLQQMFYIENNYIKPIYHIKTTKKSKAQLQFALLISLENALENGKFVFAIEAVRQKCVEHKCYDKDNFKSIFKNNSKFFKSLSDEDSVELSPDGKAELAEVISEMVK